MLNEQLIHWVEDQYNAGHHSAIGMSPIARFALDLKFIKFLPPNQANDELFYAQAQRQVKKDNTFSFNNIRYEPCAHLQGKTITIRFDRNRPDSIIVYYKDQRIGDARRLNLVANSKIKR